MNVLNVCVRECELESEGEDILLILLSNTRVKRKKVRQKNARALSRIYDDF